MEVTFDKVLTLLNNCLNVPGFKSVNGKWTAFRSVAPFLLLRLFKGIYNNTCQHLNTCIQMQILGSGD